MNHRAGNLFRNRDQHIENRLEDIHAKVEELVASRQNVREVLVVLDQNDEASKQADYILQDRTSHRTQPPPEPQGVAPGTVQSEPSAVPDVVANTASNDMVIKDGLSLPKHQNIPDTIEFLGSKDW